MQAAILSLLLLTSSLAAGPITRPTGGDGRQVERLGTLQEAWSYARNFNSTSTTGYVTSNDATPDPNAMTWQNTGDYFIVLDDRNYNSIAFFCYGDGTGDGDPNGGTFDANVYVVDPYSSWDHVSTFSCAVGELELTHNPVTGAQLNSGSLDPNQSYKWAEGVFAAGTDPIWIASPSYTGCTNGIGRCNFDASGARVIIVLIDNMSGITRVYPIVKGR